MMAAEIFVDIFSLRASTWGSCCPTASSSDVSGQNSLSTMNWRKGLRITAVDAQLYINSIWRPHYILTVTLTHCFQKLIKMRTRTCILICTYSLTIKHSTSWSTTLDIIIMLCNKHIYTCCTFSSWGTLCVALIPLSNTVTRVGWTVVRSVV